MDSYSREAGRLAASDSLMRPSLGILAQCSVVRTSLFPLGYLYKAAYSLSVRVYWDLSKNGTR